MELAPHCAADGFELDQLQRLIDESGVSAAVQVWVARMVYSDGDTLTSAVWARSAVRKAEKELAHSGLDDAAALALRQALIPLADPLNAQQDPPILEKFGHSKCPFPVGILTIRNQNGDRLTMPRGWFIQDV